jgi:UDP-N-acetylmuramate dehydrogenase
MHAASGPVTLSSRAPLITRENESLVPTAQDLGHLNTFSLPSRASDYLRIGSLDQLNALSTYVVKYEQIWVLGGGNNIILPARVEGIVVHQIIRGIKWRSEINGRIIIEAMAGENWHDLVTWGVEQGWGGLENLALIPGTVGAAPVQNIGAYGVEIEDCLISVTA